MIRSKAAVGNFVCLRCQVRRLPYYGPATAIADARSVAHSSIKQGQLHYNSTDASPKEAVSETPADNKEDLGDSNSHDSSDARRVALGAGNKHLRRRENTAYWRKGNRVVTMSQDLSVGILGKPAGALIMKELGTGFRHSGKEDQAGSKRAASKRVVRKSKKSPADNDNNYREGSVGDGEKTGKSASAGKNKAWDGLVQNRSQEPTPDEIQSYISELQPNGHNIISRRQFDELVETLVTGFTSKQLTRYVTENQRKANLKDLPNGKRAPWVEDRKPWMTENTLSRQRVDMPLQQPTARPMPGKEALVLRLMQDCWGLSVRELVTGMGHLDIHIKDPEFSLLLVGSRRWLQVISRVYLSKVGGRVELRRSDRLMRIFAPKAVAEAILSDIDDLLSSAVCERLPLKTITRQTPTKEALDRLARLTSSLIEFDAEKREVVVSCIQKHNAKADDDIGVESTVNKVYRLLLTAYGAPTASASAAIIPALDASEETGSLVVDHGVRPTSPPWNLQDGTWTRLRRPQPKAHLENHGIEDSSVEVPSSLLKWPVDANFREHFHFFTDRNPSFGGDVSASGRWSRVCTSTQATFGHVMHWNQESLSVGTRLPMTIDWKSPRMLFPGMPSLLHKDIEEPQTAGPYRTEVIIRLVPCPLNPSIKTHEPPTLELHFLTKKHSVRSLQSATLFAIHDTHQADVLLPSGPVDARITQRQISMLRGPDLHSVPHMNSIREFTMRSTLDLMGNVFRTPASIKELSLPACLMGDGRSLPESDSSGNAFVTLDYLFADLEIHRRVDTFMHDQNVVYTSIRDPLQPHRNRAEVSVHPALPASFPPDVGASGTSESAMDAGANFVAELTNDSPKAASEKFLQSIMKSATSKAMKWAVL